MIKSCFTTLEALKAGLSKGPIILQRRNYWEYVNMMFNKPDRERLQKFGPDRACAEWVLRNGGAIVWEDGKRLANFNALPPDGAPVMKVMEIDGTGSSISHYGFEHLDGCEKINKIILHDANYIENKAMKELQRAKATLAHLQVSECGNISDEGLQEIAVLDKLQKLVVYNLSYVKDLDACKALISKKLPKCKIMGE